MKNFRFTITNTTKSKKQKKTVRSLPSANIAQRYMELQRLRERISEAETLRNTR
jgi:hypothetical protein